MIFRVGTLGIRVIPFVFLVLFSQLIAIDVSVAATIERSVTCSPTRTGTANVTMQVGDTLIVSTSGCLSGGFGGENNGTWKSGPTGTENNPASQTGGNGRLNFLNGHKVTFTATAVSTSSNSTGITFSTISDNVDGANSPQILITVTTETTAPTLSSSTPTDNATNVAVADNIVLTFSESVKSGTGNIILKKSSDNSTVATISITDGVQITISGSTVTINPTSNFDSSTGYYVEIASGVIQDLANNAFAGISNSATLNFTTAAALTAPDAPTLNSVTPGDKRITIAFTAGATGGSAITDYEYSLNGGSYISAGTTTSPFTITGLIGRTAYSVTIKSKNSVGLSTASSSLSAKTTDASLDANEAAAEAARVAAVNVEAARKAKEQKELTEILSIIPKIAELTLSLGETTKILTATKCVKGKSTKFVKKGAKCPRGFVRAR
jgi:methionine-rich copper-binding protein CopC